MSTEQTNVRVGWRRDTAIFLSGQTVSMFGSMLVQYAIMWHLTLETKSGVVLMASAVFGMLPQAIVSIFGGVWADRLNRKTLIIAADASIAVTTVVLAVFMMSGYQELWLIYLTLAIRSTGAGIQSPAVMALIPQLVPTDKLLRVNGVFQSIQSGMMLIAPAAAAGIYASMSIIAIFWVDVVTAIIGIGLLLFISVPTVRTSIDTGYFTDLAKGVRYTFTHAFVRWLLVLFGIVFVLTVAPSMLTPLMVVRSFGEEVWMLTVNELSFSVGMLLGGVLVAVWGGLKNKVVTVLVSSLVFGALTLALGLSTNMWVFFGFMLLVGLAVPFFSTPATTLLQERVEPEYQGRVFGFVGVVMATAMPFGMIVFGPLADVVPVEWVLIGAGILTFVVVAIAAVIPAGKRAIAIGAQPAPAAPGHPDGDDAAADEPASQPTSQPAD
ncbi:MFS transporter [Protaetiibacter sp. SSC-01]|uniref:MFS transporter n=1 Tax=Protaetiibacter sp. SSC-01 TaxID=2759943 RepID=UPI00223BB99B|nr:MFS transporter [Protaetiibacter sp. SSC-01]